LRLETRDFDGPYCQTVDLVRRLRPADAPDVEVIGNAPLARGDLLRLSVGLPTFGGHLSITYLTQSGDAIHLVPPRVARAGTRQRFGDPQGSFTGWEIDEPFGTDMVLVLVSDDPGFLEARPEIERAEDFARHLAERIRALQAAGRRLGAQLMPVDTVEKR
jgi:serine/threonine-protein kinase